MSRAGRKGGGQDTEIPDATATREGTDADLEEGPNGTDEDGDVTTEVIESAESEGEELEEDLAEREAIREQDEEPGHHPGAMSRMYRGQTSFDFVGRKRWWFILSSIIIIAGMVSLGVRGLDLGIQFKGGTAWTVSSKTLTQSQAEKIATAAGINSPVVEVLGHVGSRFVEIQADLNALSTKQRTVVSNKVIDSLAKAAHVKTKDISITQVGPTWGGQVTHRAVEALIAFFIVVAAYISFRFEPKMAVAAFVALAHDLLVTAGIYSLAGFQVTPDTVIAVLTILGYSLYDTVVVFDRVRDNTRGFGASGRMTYSEMINLSMNQTLARSLNTSLVAILPVLSVLVIGAQLLGASTLQNYGLALTVGLLSGAYSSIFIASPVLALLKEREPRYTNIRQRLESRGDRFGLLTPSAAALIVGASTGAVGRGGGAGGAGARSNAPLRPGGAAAKRPMGKQAAGAGKSGAPRAVGPNIGNRPTGGGNAGVTTPRPRKGGPKGRSKSRSKRRR